MAAKKSNYSVLSLPGKKAGDCKFISVGDLKIAFRWCPDGMFMMGPPESQHEVKLTKGFWIMETPVTVDMFMKFVASDTDYDESKERNHLEWKPERGCEHIVFSWGNPPPDIIKNRHCPVTYVKWDDAVAFCKWLIKETGLTMQLPTEAEWEYACRAGETKEPTLEQLKEMAWIPFKGKKREIHPVAEKKPNAWGIYDMIGNVWEWCRDWHKEYPCGSVTDPTGPEDGTSRVIRGGSWASEDTDCQPSRRNWLCCQDGRWKYSSNYLGFRVVCECEQQ